MQKDKLFNKQTLLSIPAGIAVNIAGAQLIKLLGLPLFLDSVGTITVSAVGGLIPGIIVGFLSNALNSLSDPITLYYGILSIMFAFLSVFLSQKGVFRRVFPCLASCLPYALIGGSLGSVLTWLLYGLSWGEGVSARFALSLYNLAGMSEFWAQFTADTAIDVVDKLLTVAMVYLILRLLPEKLLSKLPLGGVYLNGSNRKPSSVNAEFESVTFEKLSLRNKVRNLILLTSSVLSVVAVIISFSVYKRSSESKYEDTCTNVVTYMQNVIDADRVDGYLETLRKDAEYYETEKLLQTMKKSIPDIEYMYVYKVLEDGCHVVYDLDTPDTPASELGELVPHDESFAPYRQSLIDGEEIEPVITNDTYGWLLTVYKPLKNSAGETVAYAAADIKMTNVITDQYVFVIRMVSLLFAVSVVFIMLALWFAQQNLITPINKLAAAASKCAYESQTKRRRNTERLRELDISTGDEIENLYHSLLKAFTDVNDYVDLVDEKSADVRSKAELISRMQDNIIMSFADMVESRDKNTGDHVKHTSAYVKLIGEELAKTPKYEKTLTSESLEGLARSAPLHDIGKIKISDTILNKPGRLTDEEFEHMKQHTVAGRDILAEALHGIEDDNYLKTAQDMAAHHHERWDGAGYPDGLAGEEIPLSARIMAVADVFDALISKRSYKDPFTFDEAFEIIKDESGSHFDPDVAAVFIAARSKVEEQSK